MAAQTPAHIPRESKSKRLGGNITELTAIARIKPGLYPEKRLEDEVKQQWEALKKHKIRLWLSEEMPGTNGKTTWLEHLHDRMKRGKPLEMTYLEHFRAVLGWAHRERQDEIRKMVTIHYARWVILDTELLPGIDGPHVLFTSNFDGELEEYLEDFAAIDEGPLNLIFGHCIGWPGARPADRFIQYVEQHQLPAGVFYANYPSVTVNDVNRALDWKHKTTHFVQKVVPKLRGKPAEDWARATSDYMRVLAEPTPRDREAAGRTALLRIALEAAEGAPRPKQVRTSIHTPPAPDKRVYVAFKRELNPKPPATSKAVFSKAEVAAVPYPDETRDRFKATLKAAIARLFNQARA